MNSHRNFLRFLFAVFILATYATVSCVGKTSPSASNIAELIRPEKLATLGERGANPRVQKVVYWLAVAKQQGQSPKKIANEAVALAGYTNHLARQLTADAIVRNLDIATKLGCLDATGLEAMRHGHSPTINKGPYQGDHASVDHIIPLAICPELDVVIANLELLPARMNSSKRDRVGERQLPLARKLHDAYLLSAEGLTKVSTAATKF